MSWRTKCIFSGEELLFMINNRRTAPNTPEMFEAIQSELTPCLNRCTGVPISRLSAHLKMNVNDLQFGFLPVHTVRFRSC